MRKVNRRRCGIALIVAKKPIMHRLTALTASNVGEYIQTANGFLRHLKPAKNGYRYVHDNTSSSQTPTLR